MLRTTRSSSIKLSTESQASVSGSKVGAVRGMLLTVPVMLTGGELDEACCDVVSGAAGNGDGLKGGKFMGDDIERCGIVGGCCEVPANSVQEKNVYQKNR